MLDRITTLSLRPRRGASRMLTAAMLVALAFASPSRASIAITEAMGNPNGSDTDLEYIELFNYGPDPVDLTGWEFGTDNSGSEIALPSVVIPSGGYIVLADSKAVFQGLWLGGSSDARVFQPSGTDTFDIDNGNSDNLRIVNPLGGESWRLVTPISVSGNAVYYTENDFTRLNHGDFGANDPIVVNGNDPSGTLGYETYDNTTDAFAFTTLNNDTGSPLVGAYTAMTRTVASVTDTSVVYTQDFDTLGTDDSTGYEAIGGSNPLPDGWRSFEYSGGFNSSYRGENGDNGSGDVLSLGDNGDTDRALGTLRTGGNFGMYIGAVFKNDTSEDITFITIDFTGEQWRIGADHGGPDVLDFAYSLDAINLEDGTYIDVDALDFASPTLGDASVIDGDDPANQTYVGPVTINFDTAVAPGEEFWIRWFDRQVAGSDDQLGIDNLRVAFNNTLESLDTGGIVPAPAALPAGLALGAMLVTRRRRC